MQRRFQLGALAAIGLCLPAGGLLMRVQAQDAQTEIVARARVLPEIGAGLVEMKRDSAGRYYAIASPANAILVFGPDGKRIGQVPVTSSPDLAKKSRIDFAVDFDIDSEGRILVADRGANAVKIFASDGALTIAIPVAAVTSVAALPGEEFAVTSLRSQRLMTIYSYAGKLIRAIGEPGDFMQGFDAARTPDLGRVWSDPDGNIYFVFSFLSEPTMRRFDRFGYAGNEIALDEFAPEGRRRQLLSLERRTNISAAKPQIDAFGVDPATQEIWIAVGEQLFRFDNQGARIGSYHTLSPAGAPLTPKTILVESKRLLLGTESWGVFDFARPAKASVAANAR